MKKTWHISVKIEGTASGAVEAGTEEEAIKKAIEGDWAEDFEINEWEFNTSTYDGWIEAEEEK